MHCKIIKIIKFWYKNNKANLANFLIKKLQKKIQENIEFIIKIFCICHGEEDARQMPRKQSSIN